jgi:hypothetical protein
MSGMADSIRERGAREILEKEGVKGIKELEGATLTEIMTKITNILASQGKRLWCIATYDSFHGRRSDESEESAFLRYANDALIIEVHSRPIGGSDVILGRYRISLYSDDNSFRHLRYVRVEWVAGPGYSYYAEELYKVIPAEEVPRLLNPR